MSMIDLDLKNAPDVDVYYRDIHGTSPRSFREGAEALPLYLAVDVSAYNARSVATTLHLLQRRTGADYTLHFDKFKRRYYVWRTR